MKMSGCFPSLVAAVGAPLRADPMRPDDQVGAMPCQSAVVSPVLILSPPPLALPCLPRYRSWCLSTAVWTMACCGSCRATRVPSCRRATGRCPRTPWGAWRRRGGAGAGAGGGGIPHPSAACRMGPKRAMSIESLAAVASVVARGCGRGVCIVYTHTDEGGAGHCK
jgi:hypothetical protein